MKVLYLHGFGSSGSSTTVQRLKRSLPNSFEVIAPDIPLQPEIALTTLKEVASHLGPDDIVVGTSMGAMYAQMMRGWRRILINPSFHTSRHLREKIGGQYEFFTPRKDGINTYTVTDKLCKKFEKMEQKQFQPKFGIVAPWGDKPENVQAFFGTADDVVNCKDEYLQHYSKYQDFEGGHRLTPEVTLKLIIPAILALRDV